MDAGPRYGRHATPPREDSGPHYGQNASRGFDQGRHYARSPYGPQTFDRGPYYQSQRSPYDRPDDYASRSQYDCYHYSDHPGPEYGSRQTYGPYSYGNVDHRDGRDYPATYDHRPAPRSS